MHIISYFASSSFRMVLSLFCTFSFDEFGLLYIQPIRIFSLFAPSNSQKTLSSKFLHFHKIVEGLYFHFNSVCLCVRRGYSCEQNSSQTDAPIWTRFLLNGCLAHWLGPFILVTLGQRSSSQWLNIHFFLHNSLLTSLLYISALYIIKIKWGMTSCQFSPYNCPYFKFY